MQAIAGLTLYAAALGLAAAVLKYGFKVNVVTLLPSLFCLIAYAVSVAGASMTQGKDPNVLFYVWTGVLILAFISGLAWAALRGASTMPQLTSMVFQVPYCLYLFYYGGLIFTHKFD
jgi:hypothetical protein